MFIDDAGCRMKDVVDAGIKVKDESECKIKDVGILGVE